MPTAEQIRRVACVAKLYGLMLPTVPVCRGHNSPAEMAAQIIYDRPANCLWHGSRGCGKSLGASFGAYMGGQIYPGYEAKILGGSQAQSSQIYNGLDFFRKALPEADAIEVLNKTSARFYPIPGSDLAAAAIEMLTASSKSVRGPHVPQLFLDEVDEIAEDIREDSYGMLVEKSGLKVSVVMTSTWHRPLGPMSQLIKKGREGAFPVGCFCAFDVLERCPKSRSGPNLEECPKCPIVQWCHADRQHDPNALPKAKRSCGHYTIDSLIQKANGVSKRVFESDYLCGPPRAQGMWFTDFNDDDHVTESAEYRPGHQYHVAIDCGTRTGAVAFQVRKSWDATEVWVNVFGDYYSEQLTAEQNALDILKHMEKLTGSSVQDNIVSMDPVGRQKSQIGPTVVGEYKRSGCVGRNHTITSWREIGPGRPKADTLATVESLLKSASGTVYLTVHPRCKHLVPALKGYLRKKVAEGQYGDEPEDPQHPAEDLVDALAGGLTVEIPEGRVKGRPFVYVPASTLM